MKHIILLAAVFAVAFLLVSNKVPSYPYAYDEADYMYAASLGMERNWVDAGTMPIAEFVRRGLKRDPQASGQASLSAQARSLTDPAFYRHERGPLYFYLLMIPASLGLDEHSTRALSLIFPLSVALVMYFGSLLILGGAEGQMAAILSSALLLWSPATLENSELSPHTLFALFYVCALLLLAKVEAGGGRRYYYAAVACAGLAYATMEVTFVLVLVLAIFAWRRRDLLASDLRLARNAAALFLAIVLAAWPASLFKLTFVKVYMVMAYLAVFRKAAWGDVTLGQAWVSRFLISPVDWCLFILALLLLALPGKGLARAGARIFLLFAALMILATFRIYAEGPRYLTPFFSAVQLFTAWMLASVLARLTRPWLSYGALVAICGLSIWNAHHQLSRFLVKEDTRPAAALSALRAGGLGEKTLLAPGVEIPRLHYYFPRMHVQGYSSAAEIAAAQNGDRFDAVLYPDYSLKIAAPAARP